MIDPLLQARLHAAVTRQRRLRLWCALATTWAALALVAVALAWLQRRVGFQLGFAWQVLVVVGAGAGLYLAWRQSRVAPDWRAAALRLEARYAGLDGALLTAVEQQAPVGGSLSYLQDCVVRHAVQHSLTQDWTQVVSPRRMALAHLAQFTALACLLLALAPLRQTSSRATPLASGAGGLTVTPGDTTLERGDSLVVLARFGGRVPAKVDLVLATTGAESRRVPLVRSLADPMFGASVPGIAHDLVYRLEYAGERTRDYRVRVFDYPRLERSTAQLTYPDYTGLPPKRIEDTQRISAVEGTRLALDLQLNKPVASARLVPRSQEQGTNTISLRVERDRAVASVSNWTLTASGAYDLRLVDADGRTNKTSTPFLIDVLPDRRPELRLASPRGDQRPSALEEINFEGTVWDDFGVSAFGLAYTVSGQDTKVIELGREVPGQQRRSFEHLLRLEDLGAEPDHVITWSLWADDVGPDGKVRRTDGDLFFAEVRPFDQVFREGQGTDSQAQQSGGDQEGEAGNPSARLAELQKQIISATWKLQQRTDNHALLASRTNRTERAGYAQDVGVVRDSQAQALDQAASARQRADDPRSIATWQTAISQMQVALERLSAATNSPAPLSQALKAEQAAYQALLKLQQREFEVARARNRGQNANSSRQQTMQRELDQLDLAQSENRYETERQAQAPLSTERREQLQVLNRLQELARRQQDVNERLKELQTALQEARTAAEREQARRRLERLREDEQQVLADLDELRQRLDRAENQSQTADARRQLDQTREEVQRAAEAAAQGAASQSLAAGTRAQRQMQQLRDDLRRSRAGEFADDLRDLRAEARELSRRQETIERNLQAVAEARRRTLTDAPEARTLAEDLARQRQRLTNLVESATLVSQQTETAEPLVSTELYESLRKFAQDDTGIVKESREELLQRGLLTQDLAERLGEPGSSERARALQLTAELLRQGHLPQASQAEQRARAALDDLRRGVERAAERVLGDDTESLRLAQRQLAEATAQLGQEIATGQTAAARGTNAPSATVRDGGRNRQQSEPPDGQRPRTDRFDRLFNDDFVRNPGPITGDNFGPWSDRLREVEELVELPFLRGQVATARERTRELRRAYRRDLTKPDWAMVRLQVMQPLVQVRDQIAEELARREPGERLVPLDRDPVPGRFSELVRRYYEELGRAK